LRGGERRAPLVGGRRHGWRRRLGLGQGCGHVTRLRRGFVVGRERHRTDIDQVRDAEDGAQRQVTSLVGGFHALTVARENEPERTPGDIPALHLGREAQRLGVVGVQVDLVPQADLVFDDAERASLRPRQHAAGVVVEQPAHVRGRQGVTERTG
jgi:hypothetical protein